MKDVEYFEALATVLTLLFMALTVFWVLTVWWFWDAIKTIVQKLVYLDEYKDEHFKLVEAFTRDLWTDTVSHKVYHRYPAIITSGVTDAKMTANICDSRTRIFNYFIGTGDAYQIIPKYIENFIMGRIRS